MKSILVHLDASPRAAERLALAQRLARRHGADVTVLYGVLPAMLALPWVAADASGAAASLMADVDRTQLERARATFDHAAVHGPLTWVDASTESLQGALLQHALYTDLVVMGQPDPEDLRTGPMPPDLVPALIVDSGKPTLLVPSAGAYEGAPERVLLAWKPTREAARAVTAALPWLSFAQQVDVAVSAVGDSDDDGFKALERWLRQEGVDVPIRRHRLGLIDAGEALLSVAADTSAELLVMGCYGHSRAREWVLGGASRTVLRAMTLPVLMVH